MSYDNSPLVASGEAVICAALDLLTPAQFQTELRDCLTSYYETVRMMVGAGGTLSIKTHQRKFKPPTSASSTCELALVGGLNLRPKQQRRHSQMRSLLPCAC